MMGGERKMVLGCVMVFFPKNHNKKRDRWRKGVKE